MRASVKMDAWRQYGLPKANVLLRIFRFVFVPW